MPTVEEYFDEGIKHLEAKEWDEAIACFTDVIKLPANAVTYVAAYNNRASAYGQKGDFDHAIEDCNEAIKINPNYAGAYHNRAGVYLGIGAHDLAIADLDKAINLKPRFASAYYNRGNIFRIKRNYGRAIEDYNKAIELDSDNVSAYHNRGYTYGMMGEYDRAIEDYGKVIKIESDFAGAYSARGSAHVAKGNYDLAIADCSKAIELDQNIAGAYHGRGAAYAGKRDYGRAIEDYNKAIELNPDSVAIYYYRANAYNKNGKPKEEAKDRRKIRRHEWGHSKWFQEKLKRLKKKTQRDGLTKLLDAVLEVKDKLRFDFRESQNTTVAHYTSRGILPSYFRKENGKFRLYSSDSMNDPTEGREIFRIINENWGVDLEKELYFGETSKNHEVTYIGSFVSGVGCEDKLLFWRTYGEDALGCSLSFGEEALSKTEDLLADKRPTSVYGPQSSIYESEPQPPIDALKSQSKEPYEHHVAPPVSSSEQQNKGPKATLEPHAFYKVVYGENKRISNMLKDHKAQIKSLFEESDNGQKK